MGSGFDGLLDDGVVLLPLLLVESVRPVLGVLESLGVLLGVALGALPGGGLSLAELLRVPFLVQPTRLSVAMIAVAVISLRFCFIIVLHWFVRRPCTGVKVTGGLRIWARFYAAPHTVAFPRKQCLLPLPN